MLLKRLAANGVIKNVETHSKQGLYTPVAVPVDKSAAPADGKEEKKGGKKDGAKKAGAEKAGGEKKEEKKQPK
jgi:hypothetical protein